MYLKVVQFAITLMFGALCFPNLTDLLALPQRRDSSAQPRERTFEFTYRATIASVPLGTKHLEVWLPYPKSDENQDIFDIEIDTPSDATVHREPVYDNRILYVSIDRPESVPQNIQLKFKVRRREYLRRDFDKADENAIRSFDPEIEKFLKPKRLKYIEQKQ